MTEQLLFTERQAFRQWWLWLILLGLFGLFAFGSYMQIILEQDFGNNPMSNAGLKWGVGLSLLLILGMYSFRLETAIKREGVYVRFFPLELRYSKHAWEVIARSYIREYNPISEYGGWGWRHGDAQIGKALSISGRMGLQLEFKNGEKLLIGTQRAEEIEQVLEQISKIDVS